MATTGPPRLPRRGRRGYVDEGSWKIIPASVLFAFVIAGLLENPLATILVCLATALGWSSYQVDRRGWEGFFRQYADGRPGYIRVLVGILAICTIFVIVPMGLTYDLERISGEPLQ